MRLYRDTPITNAVIGWATALTVTAAIFVFFWGSACALLGATIGHYFYSHGYDYSESFAIGKSKAGHGMLWAILASLFLPKELAANFKDELAEFILGRASVVRFWFDAFFFTFLAGLLVHIAIGGFYLLLMSVGPEHIHTLEGLSWEIPVAFGVLWMLSSVFFSMVFEQYRKRRDARRLEGVFHLESPEEVQRGTALMSREDALERARELFEREGRDERE